MFVYFVAIAILFFVDDVPLLSSVLKIFVSVDPSLLTLTFRVSGCRCRSWSSSVEFCWLTIVFVGLVYYFQNWKCVTKVYLLVRCSWYIGASTLFAWKLLEGIGCLLLFGKWFIVELSIFFSYHQVMLDLSLYNERKFWFQCCHWWVLKIGVAYIQFLCSMVFFEVGYFWMMKFLFFLLFDV